MIQTNSTPSCMNERLGFGPDERLLLVNADDAGMCQAVNAGVERAFHEGSLTSCTAMVPCPWFDDFARRARADSRIKVGVHLVTTSEWDSYRWGPVSPREKVPSLLDSDGYFFRSEEEYYSRADPLQVEMEFRAQIERFLASGLKPTHLDSHMGVYHLDEGIFQIARGLAQEYKITMRVAVPERVAALQGAGWAVVDHIFFETHDVPLEERRKLYHQIFENLPSGLTELVIHPAEPTPELRAIGGMWQRRGFDLEFFTNPETAHLLDELKIKLVGYDDLRKLTAAGLGWPD